LDAAERGGMMLDEIGEVLNLSRERVRQIEAEALEKIKPLLDSTDLYSRNTDPGSGNYIVTRGRRKGTRI
jgi:hypothetical protein